MKYAVERGYRLLQFKDGSEQFIEFMVNDDVTVKVVGGKGDYEVIINGYGGFYTKEVNNEVLHKAADTIVKRIIKEFTF